MASIENDLQAKQLFWESVGRRAMELPYCCNCNVFFFYPRPICPHCWGDQVEFRTVNGYGRLWSYTIVRFAHGNAHDDHPVPYTVALVDLDEGVRLMANLLDCPSEAIQSGMRLQLTYREHGGRTLPAFIPVA